MGLRLGDEPLPLPVETHHLGPLGLYYNRWGWDLRVMFGLSELILVSYRR